MNQHTLENVFWSLSKASVLDKVMKGDVNGLVTVLFGIMSSWTVLKDRNWGSALTLFENDHCIVEPLNTASKSTVMEFDKFLTLFEFWNLVDDNQLSTITILCKHC